MVAKSGPVKSEISQLQFYSTDKISLLKHCQRILEDKCYFALCTNTSKDQISLCSKVTVGHQAINNPV